MATTTITGYRPDAVVRFLLRPGEGCRRPRPSSTTATPTLVHRHRRRRSSHRPCKPTPATTAPPLYIYPSHHPVASPPPTRHGVPEKATDFKREELAGTPYRGVAHEMLRTKTKARKYGWQHFTLGR